MKKPKVKVREDHPRVSLGLEAANAGDIGGAIKFLRFAESELNLMGVWSDLPEAIRIQCRSVALNCRSAALFLEGYASATEAKSTSGGGSGRMPHRIAATEKGVKRHFVKDIIFGDGEAVR